MGPAGRTVRPADLVDLPYVPAWPRRRPRRRPERLAAPRGPGKIRDPAALPGWLARTTRRECIRVLPTPCRTHAPIYALDAENLPDEQADPADQELLAAERRAALREAFKRLPPDGQQLIAILITDP